MIALLKQNVGHNGSSKNGVLLKLALCMEKTEMSVKWLWSCAQNNKVKIETQFQKEIAKCFALFCMKGRPGVHRFCTGVTIMIWGVIPFIYIEIVILVLTSVCTQLYQDSNYPPSTELSSFMLL